MASGHVDRIWADALATWAIPDDLVVAAPVSPCFFDVAVFVAAADEALARTADSPSDVATRAAMVRGGAVLDVGAGAGAASLRLADDAGRIVAVDTGGELLSVFAARATALGVAHEEIEGRWPDVAGRVAAADVVVCHHVFYNVPDLAPFAEAMTSHARRRVVVECTTSHPLGWMAPYWQAMHGLAQPERPVVEDAIAVLAALGIDVHQQRWRRRLQMIGESEHQALERIARRLCLPPERHEELRRALTVTPPPAEREVVTLWWDGSG